MPRLPHFPRSFVTLAVLMLLAPALALPGAIAEGGNPREPVTNAPPRFLDSGSVGTGTQEVRLYVPWSHSTRVNPAGLATEYTTLVVAPRTEFVPDSGIPSMLVGVSRCVAIVEKFDTMCVALSRASSCTGLATTAYCVRGDPAALGGVHIGVVQGHTALRVTLLAKQQEAPGRLDGAVTVSFDNAAWTATAPRGSINVPFVTDAPAAGSVSIRTAAGGAGDAPDALTTTTDPVHTFFAAGYDENDAYVADQPEAVWSLSGAPVATLNRTTGESVSLDAVKAGTAALTVTLGNSSDALLLTITPGAPARIVIRDAPSEEGGSDVGTASMTADDTLRLFADGYDADGNYLGPVDATWTVTGVEGPCGAIAVEENGAAVFDAQVAGVHKCRVHAEAGTGADATGVITVAPGQPVGLAIHGASQGGAPVGEFTLASNESAALFAIRTDADGNPTPDVDSVSWRVVGDCGRVSRLVGPSVTFDPTRVNPDEDCRVVATTQSSLATLLDVLPALAIPMIGGLVLDKSEGVASTGAITVTQGPLALVKIRSEAGGEGVEITAPTLTTDETQTWYAAGYDADGNYVGDIGDIGVAWSLSDATVADLTDNGASVVLDPKKPGSTVLTVETSAGVDTTGTILIETGEIATLLVRDAAGNGGEEIAGIALPSGDSFTAYAAGYDADGNYVDDVYADWGLLNPCGEISADEGYTTVFTAGLVAREACRVQAAFDGAEGDTGDIAIQTPDPSSIVIRLLDESEAVDLVKPAGYNITLAAAGYNGDGVFIGNQSATHWSVVAAGEPCGTIEPAGAVVQFTPINTTRTDCRVVATVATTSGSVVDDTGVITVLPGDTHSITVAGMPLTMTAGAGLGGPITISVFDEFGNLNTSYEDTIRFQVPDLVAGGAPRGEKLPTTAQATYVPATHAGVRAFEGDTFDLRKTGERTLRVVALENNVEVATSEHTFPITVYPGALHDFVVDAPNTVIAGLDLNKSVNITARDAYQNVKTNHTGQVVLYTNDARATLPAVPLVFEKGDEGVLQLNASLVFKTKGARNLTAIDVATGKTGSKLGGGVSVEAASAVGFVVTLPGQTFDVATGTNTGTPNAQKAGAEYGSVQVRAVDEFGNLLDNTGTNRFHGSKSLVFTGASTAWDGTAPKVRSTLLQDRGVAFGESLSISFSNGVANARIAQFRQESVALTVAESATGGLTGTSTAVTIDAGAAFQLGLNVGCTPTPEVRTCLVASESVTDSWKPTVGVSTPYHLQAVVLDEWDNLIGSASAVWSGPDLNPAIATSGPEAFWRPADETSGTLTLSATGLVSRMIEVEPQAAS